MGSKNSLFNLIAPIYGWFFNYQKRHYTKILNDAQNEIDFCVYNSILDVGCGTGALCSVLSQKGLSVTGIDSAQRMLNIAMAKEENKGIAFVPANVIDKLPFKDKSFDISIAAYVAHGLHTLERKIMYAEMNRVTKCFVIIYDYNKTRSFIIDIIERLEGGNYFCFIDDARFEMEAQFGDIRIIDIGLTASLYICEPN